MLDSQVAELESSLEKVKVLLEEQSPTVQEAQHLLKVSAPSCGSLSLTNVFF